MCITKIWQFYITNSHLNNTFNLCDTVSMHTIQTTQDYAKHVCTYYKHDLLAYENNKMILQCKWKVAKKILFFLIGLL